MDEYGDRTAVGQGILQPAYKERRGEETPIWQKTRGILIHSSSQVIWAQLEWYRRSSSHLWSTPNLLPYMLNSEIRRIIVIRWAWEPRDPSDRWRCCGLSPGRKVYEEMKLGQRFTFLQHSSHKHTARARKKKFRSKSKCDLWDIFDLLMFDWIKEVSHRKLLKGVDHLKEDNVFIDKDTELTVTI